jgi:hypothetical protein
MDRTPFGVPERVAGPSSTACADTAWSSSDARLGTPTATPPDGCVDQAVWRLAHGLHAQHEMGADGRCARCDGTYPCVGQRLARTGLVTALGYVTTDSSYWTAYARVLAFHNATEPPRLRDGRP